MISFVCVYYVSPGNELYTIHTYLNDMIMAVAIPLIFKGNISPKRANNTGATPIPQAKAVHMTLTGNKITLISDQNPCFDSCVQKNNN